MLGVQFLYTCTLTHWLFKGFKLWLVSFFFFFNCPNGPAKIMRVGGIASSYQRSPLLVFNSSLWECMDKNMNNSLSLNHSFCCLLSPIHFAAGSCRENDSFQFLSPFFFTVGWQKKNVVKECSQFFSSCCLPCLSFISFFHSYMSWGILKKTNSICLFGRTSILHIL